MTETADEAEITRGLHIGFVAPARAHVDAFWRAGVDAGHPSDREPGRGRGRRPPPALMSVTA